MPARGREVTIALAIDLIAVCAFVLIGRRSHDENGTVSGFFGTAWPFLAALVVGWLLARVWLRPTEVWPTGVIVWLVTVIGGLGLRGVIGGGLAWTFLLVTAVVLALFLLGWRAVAHWAARRHTKDVAQNSTTRR